MAHDTHFAALAWRNLWRNRRRTLITVSGIAFGMLLAVLFTGLGDALYSDMIDDAAKGMAGHVTVQHPEYQDLPSAKKTVSGFEAIRADAKEQRVVEAVVPRVTGAAMVATASNSFGAFFMAVDPERESSETLVLLDKIVDGEMFVSSGDKGIVLGATLAENLDVAVGKKLVYTVTDKEGEIVSNMARVRGIVRTGSPGVDNGLCLLPLGTLQQLVGYASDEVTQVAIFVGDNRDSGRVARRLDEALPEAAVALTWQQTSPDLAGYIAMEIGGTIVMEGIIMVLLAAGIFNTLFVSVMERLREFGIMRAIGFAPRQLFRIVMWESVWLALTGMVAAALVTAYPYYYLNTEGVDYAALMELDTTTLDVAGVTMKTHLYVDIYANHLALICFVVLLATMSAGIYPAWRAGRVAPADAIRLV